jgi:hypothetical protein
MHLKPTEKRDKNINQLKNKDDLKLYQQKINEKLKDTNGIQDV